MCWKALNRELFSSISKSFFNFLQGLGLVFLILLYEGVVFIVSVSICIGLTAFISFIHEVCFFRPMSSVLQGSFSLFFIMLFGEGNGIIQNNLPHCLWFRTSIDSHTTFIKQLPGHCYLALGMVAYFELFVQYQKAHHSLFFDRGGKRVADSGPEEPNYLDKTSTMFFLLSLSYLAYIITRSSDWMRYRYELSLTERRTLMSSCKLFCLYICLQLVLLLIYSIPILLGLFVMRELVLSPELIFFFITVTALLIGVNVSYLENHVPFPTQPMLPPAYRYESFLAARVSLIKHALIFCICVSYYFGGKLYFLTGSRDQFIFFSYIMGCTGVQVVKVLFNTSFRQALKLVRERERGRDVEDQILRNGPEGNLEQIESIDINGETTDKNEIKGEILMDLNFNVNEENNGEKDSGEDIDKEKVNDGERGRDDISLNVRFEIESEVKVKNEIESVDVEQPDEVDTNLVLRDNNN